MNNPSFPRPPLYRPPYRGTMPELRQAVTSLYTRARQGSPAATAEITALRAKAQAGDQAALSAHRMLIDVHEAAQTSGQTWDAARDLYARLRAGDQNARQSFEEMKRNPRGREIVGRVNQLQRESAIFPDGPGAPRVGAFPMPLQHRPGVGPSRGYPTAFAPPQQARARFAVSGQKLTNAQIQELIVMMQLAAQGLGPEAFASPAPSPGPSGPAGGGGGLDDILKQLAKSRADAAKLQAAKQKLFSSPTALRTILTDTMAFSRANNLGQFAAQPAAPYAGPSMSDTGVGPNPQWAPGEVQPYAQGSLDLSFQDPSASAQGYWNG